MMDAPLWLPFAFLAVALVYAMVGFGGGSSYLAVLALTTLPYRAVPQIALLCNDEWIDRVLQGTFGINLAWAERWASSSNCRKRC